MSFAASVALQGAVYQHLRADPALLDLVGDAIFEALKVSFAIVTLERVRGVVLVGSEEAGEAVLLGSGGRILK